MTTATRIYERHPLSALWGDVPEAEFQAMLESVKDHGFEEPRILLADGMVLDGWHRYRIALLLSRVHELTFTVYEGDDLAALVIRRNGHRRHLDASQRAAIVVACYDWRPTGLQPDQERDPETGQIQAATETETEAGTEEAANASNLKSNAEMADLANTSVRTLQDAKVAHEGGLGPEVQAGNISASGAARQVREERQADTPTEASGQAEDIQQDTGDDTPEPPRQRRQRRPQQPRLTPEEKALLERDQARADAADKAKRIETLEEQVRLLEAQGAAVPAATETAIQAKTAEADAVRAELATLRTRHSELEQAHAGALARIKQLEAMVKSQADTPPATEEAPATGKPKAIDADPETEESRINYVAPAINGTIPPEGETCPVHNRVIPAVEGAQCAVCAKAEAAINGFVPGQFVLTDDGEYAVFQGYADDRENALVVTEFGTGQVLAVTFDSLSAVEA